MQGSVRNMAMEMLTVTGLLTSEILFRVISFLDIPGFIAILRNQYTEVILVFVSFVFFVVDQKIHEPVPPQLRRM